MHIPAGSSLVKAKIESLPFKQRKYIVEEWVAIGKLNYRTNRDYHQVWFKARFSDAASDVVNARIHEGIHFRFADTAARRQGRHVANWDFEHFLRRINDDSHHHHRSDKQ